MLTLGMTAYYGNGKVHWCKKKKKKDTAVCNSIARFSKNAHRILCLHAGLGPTDMLYSPSLWEIAAPTNRAQGN